MNQKRHIEANGKNTKLYSEAEAFIEGAFKGRTVKKVLFVTLPDADISIFNYKSAKLKNYYLFPPYGVGLLSTQLLENNYEPEICDLNLEILRELHRSTEPNNFDFEKIWKTKLHQKINSFKPDLIGVSCLFTMTQPLFFQVCKEIKKTSPDWLGGLSKIPLAVGGVHITQSYKKILKDLPEIDFAFLHESELAFLNFLDVANRNLPATKLSQLVLNSPEKEIILNDLSFKPIEKDIDIWPAYQLMEISEYSKYGRMGSFSRILEPPVTSATVLSNRGCRAACTFCSVRNFNGMGVRKRNVKEVVDEIHFLHDEYGVNHIMWLDDDLLYDEKRAISLFNELANRNLDISWDATNGVIASSCTDEVISAAAKSGCIGMNIGVESGNDKILRKIKKPGRVDNFLKAAEVIKKYGSISSRAFLMLGFPNETNKMISETLSLALNMDLDWYNITLLEPLPNTPIFDLMTELGAAEEVGKPSARTNSGPLGKSEPFENRKSFTKQNLVHLFQNSGLSQTPTRAELSIIWFYANYYLNFRPLFSESHRSKFKRKAKYIKAICGTSAPKNGFAVYFNAFAQRRLQGRIDNQLINRLKFILKESEFWQTAFNDLGVSLENLETGDFPIKPKFNNWLSLFDENIT